MCMVVFFACMSVYNVCAVPGGGQKRTLHSLRLELQLVVRLYLGIRNQTEELWKSIRYS